ncbi:hypothetical protein KIPB_011265, partial [Kipferlia bialata]|eukprot:g11265.t1
MHVPRSENDTYNTGTRYVRMGSSTDLLSGVPHRHPASDPLRGVRAKCLLATLACVSVAVQLVARSLAPSVPASVGYWLDMACVWLPLFGLVGMYYTDTNLSRRILSYVICGVGAYPIGSRVSAGTLTRSVLCMLWGVVVSYGFILLLRVRRGTGKGAVKTLAPLHSLLPITLLIQ